MEPFRPLEIEKEISEYWDKLGLFEKIKKANEAGEKFFFLDGPPYMNGNPHMGHARTRAIRDPILKYQVMLGKDVNLQPGYDCHGLPIEIKVEEELGLKRKEDIWDYGAEKFIDICRTRALETVDVFTEFYKRFGMHWDFEHPYKTLDNSYISSSWAFFKKCEEDGLLYKGKASTAWCPRCQTALAGYEATDEYRDVTDDSVYVKFPLKERPGEFVLIWTTTPWTLPSNLGVTLNPKYEYCLVSVPRDEKWLMAKELVPQVMEACEIEDGDYEILEDSIKQGKELEGVGYEFILPDWIPENKEIEKEAPATHSILLGDFVTLEDGTGCVHTAPGHGLDDYSVGMKYGLPPFSPVGENGCYTKEGGKLEGVYVKKANPIVIEELENRGAIAGKQKITHRCAHCWRCKTPIITRASPQWFINVGKVKDLMISENKKVTWNPDWAGEKRFSNWIKEARDWCISRQRFWGIPLPIWECSCGAREVIGSFEELKEKAIEMPEGEPDLHVPYTNKIKLSCPDCQKEMTRVPDITDIWFESGAATWAGMNYPKEKEPFTKFFPMDFITEGLDQTRGWFYTLMLEGIIMFGKTPFKTVLMNEWVLDKKGDKMSKSLNNVTSPYEVMEKYGADITRFYLVSESEVWEKLKFNADDVKITFRLMNTLWNCYQFAKTYSEAGVVDIEGLRDFLKPEDKWILSRLASVEKLVKDGFDACLPFGASKAIEDFILNDLSRWYIKIIRDRTWVSATGEDKDAAIATLWYAIAKTARMIAPFAPFIAEYIHRDLEGGDSVFLSGWPEINFEIDASLEREMQFAKEIVEASNAARDEAGIKLRWPLDALTVDTKEKLETVREVIENMANVNEVAFSNKEPNAPVIKEFSSGRIMISKIRSPEAIQEGMLRDLLRQIQVMRKKEGLDVSEKIVLRFDGDEKLLKLIKKRETEIAQATGASAIELDKIDPKDLKSKTEIEGAQIFISYSK